MNSRHSTRKSAIKPPPYTYDYRNMMKIIPPQILGN